MKKRIFIAIHYLEIGGAEISLIGLLNAIDTEQYDVDLFLYSHRGELLKQVPNTVHLLPEIKKYDVIEKPIKEAIQKGFPDIALARLWAKYQFARYAKKNHLKEGSAIFQYVLDAVTPLLPDINPNTEYDLAISFLTPHNIVLNKVKAKKKLAWIHTDYTKISVNVEKEIKVWSQFDHIVSISEDVTRSFLSAFPTLAGKIIEITNILSPQTVRAKALASKVDFPIQNGRVNLLSVGRFTFAKNFDNVPDICRRILQEGCEVYWYIVGYGGDERLIKEKIKEAGVEEHVILLGKRENPYPFIKECDIYVQPSRFEGNAVTVREAQILCKPVVAANYPTAHSQIKQGVDGIIVPQDNADCAHEIAQFIRNEKLQQKIVGYLKEHDYGNEKEVQKLYSLMN
jgi:glycosyltransferase involved in cell wall biosynthesis